MLPLPALTTYELARYRAELEHALHDQPGPGPACGLLQARLAEVLAEQADRSRITRPGAAR